MLSYAHAVQVLSCAEPSAKFYCSNVRAQSVSHASGGIRCVQGVSLRVAEKVHMPFQSMHTTTEALSEAH